MGKESEDALTIIGGDGDDALGSLYLRLCHHAHGEEQRGER